MVTMVGAFPVLLSKVPTVTLRYIIRDIGQKEIYLRRWKETPSNGKKNSGLLVERAGGQGGDATEFSR